MLITVFSIFTILQVNTANQESLTWDEIQHFKIGYSALFYNDFTVDPLSGTLIQQLAALPALFSNPNFQYSRLIISFLSLLTAFTIFFFTRKWFGDITAFLASCFFLFEPTIFSHSHYITLDIGFTLLFFITYWLLITFYQKQNLKNLLILGLSTGFLSAAKVTGISYLGITLTIFYFIFRKKITKIFSPKYLFMFITTVIFSIWFIYRFQFGTLGGFTEGGLRQSNLIVSKLESINPVLANLFKKSLTTPVPLGGYLRIIKNTAVYNLSPKSSFFMGEMRSNSVRLYLPLLLLKTPLPLIIFFFLGILGLKDKKKLFILFIPIVSILIYMFFSNVNLRLRYILPIYPFIAIISASGFTNFFKKSPVFRIPLLLLLVLFFITFRKSLPHTISYANELSTFFGKPYTIFSDSNIDWGQGLIGLKKYVNSRNVGIVNLSYYGTDNPNEYGFYGYNRGNVCQKPCTIEPTMVNWEKRNNVITALSITNWQECGFYNTDKFSEKNIKGMVGGSLLIF